jgi:hypothetical protein
MAVLDQGLGGVTAYWTLAASVAMGTNSSVADRIDWWLQILLELRHS